MWHNLLVALALILIIEGIMPFLSPDRLRRTLLTLSKMSDNQLRTMGSISMLAGLIALYLIN